jgi:hypothetical protein
MAQQIFYFFFACEYQNNAEFYSDFVTVEKNAKHLPKKRVAKCKSFLINTTNLQKFFGK